VTVEKVAGMIVCIVELDWPDEFTPENLPEQHPAEFLPCNGPENNPNHVLLHSR
jgi:hypothetical protein